MNKLTLFLLAVCLAAGAQTTAPDFQGKMGNVDHKVSTGNAQAQHFFNQGLALIFGFNHDEAVKSFQRAVEIDPNLAMAHWGIALCYGANYNLPSMPEREKLAADSMQKALALAPKATPREQDYIKALSQRYSEDPKADLKQLAEDYAKAMRALSEKYPDDLDAATLYAESMMNLRPWTLWNVDGTPAPGTEEIVSTLESVLKRDPHHTGANHYYIHAVEASQHPGRALASAGRLGELAPGAGHLVHMPSHIYARVGDFDSAAKVNIDAAKADEAYIAQSKAEGIYPMMYYSHNIHFESHARSMEGRYAEAMKAAEKLRKHTEPHIKMMPMLEGFAVFPLQVMERFQKWDEILALPAPAKEHAYHTSLWHFARGMAFANKGNVAKAEAEYSAMGKAIKMISPELIIMQNKANHIITIGDDILAARIAREKKDWATAEAKLKHAIDTQDHLTYIEPPEWIYPVRESLGGMYLAAGKLVEAEQTFREDLDRNPRSGRSLFGLVAALKGQKKDAAAALVQKQLDEVWKTADVKLMAAAM
jgi:tetratricopeptide (TPR) repeat protein